MPNLIAISPNDHRHLKVVRAQALVNQTGTHMVPVIVDEFRRLSAEFPIVFVKNIDTGQFVVVALMGFEEGENLFFEHGNFTASSMPLNFLRQPFNVGLDEDKTFNLSVCVDIEHPAVGEQVGDALFNDDGSQSEMLQNVSSVLATLYHGDETTNQFVDFLSSHNLIMPVQVKAEFEDHSNCEVGGIYTVDEEALTKMSSDKLGEMMRQDYLRLAYTAASSLSQISMLIQRKNRCVTQNTVA